MRARLLVFLAAAFTALTAAAQALNDIEFEGRLKRLEAELRCLVCQNQTLADSSAPLAEDLRREVRSLATSGKSDEEIKTLTAGLGALEAQMAEIELKAFAQVYKSLEKEQIAGTRGLFPMMKGMFSGKNWNAAE